MTERLALSLLLLGCARSPERLEPAQPVAVASVEAPPIDVAPPAEQELAPVKVDAGGRSLPPTGDYDLVTTIAHGDCDTREATPPRTTVLVIGRAWKDGRIGANVLLLREGRTGDRSDVGIDPKAAKTFTVHPDRACPAYSVERTIELTDATHDVIRVTVTDRKSDRAACGSPSKACTTKLKYVYGLAKELCAAGCSPKLGPIDAGTRVGGLGVIDCICGQ